MPVETINDLLARAARRPETGLRLLDRHERPAWAGWDEIRLAALDVGGALRALGVRSGERVALVFPTGLDFFHAFFGILAAGAVPVPLYPPARFGRRDAYRHRTAGMLRAAGVRLVLTEPHLQRLLAPAVAAAAPELGCRTLAELTLEELPPACCDPVAAAPSDLGLIQFSSGTTVDPKPVALSQRAILAHARALNAFWPDVPQTGVGEGTDPGDGVLKHSGVSWLPLYHDMGLIGCVFPALERPGVLTLIAPEVFVARPAVWLRAISRYRATLSVAPNFAYGLCTEKIRDRELDGVELGSWQLALNGSEPVAPSVLRGFQQRFARWGFRPEALTPVYGLAEATLAVTFSDLAERFCARRFDRRHLAQGRAVRVGCEVGDGDCVELVSVGRPLDGVTLRIVDERRMELPPGRIGRVEVRGPSIMEGYLDRPQQTAEVLRGGWLDTGDLGFLDGGELFLSARAKDLIILRGRNYAPTEIELATEPVEGVRQGCVAAVSQLPEGAPGEELLLFVEHRRGVSTETLAGLPGACRAAILAATGLRPDKVHLLPPGTLPRTSSGKLRRRETLRRYLAGELDSVRIAEVTVA